MYIVVYTQYLQAFKFYFRDGGTGREVYKVEPGSKQSQLHGI